MGKLIPGAHSRNKNIRYFRGSKAQKYIYIYIYINYY